ncbi:2-oxoadipate dehydrogenase complex component E1-like isoform X2 [Mytilus californianus]|uniref:2-oxoadipate dehydrogenase complex component E1-like isoform X2 n=1 Tax=Mytilus californianus TaxID=6549 RepID=UPI002246B518|nr:2-oxoadipate dehydrogenase complex component E1-like isoform X2 [Mytilus californianus]
MSMLTLWRLHTAPRIFRSAYANTSLYHSENGIYGHRRKEQSRLSTEKVTQNVVTSENFQAYRLTEAYRKHGHKKATLDPLGLQQRCGAPEVELSNYGLSKDSTNQFDVNGILNNGATKLNTAQLIDTLESIYCGPIAVEFDYLQTEEREWFAHTFESQRKSLIPDERKADLAKLMLKCQAFDHFLANKFTTVKRYGGEGGESMMAIFDEIFSHSAQDDISHIVMCMPHRGRLNFLTCTLKFPPVIMFQKMKGKSELPPGAKGTGDVLSHLYTSEDIQYHGKDIHVSLIPNPSHLEANNPVAVGKARSKQQRLKVRDYSETDTSNQKVLCVQVHGDASFSAQGVVAETFGFAECPHFNVGGSIHIIVNNQLGFTTEPSRARSSLYSSCLAKINSYPVIHVNADYPEEVIRATSLAMQYQQTFGKDVIIDFICFRKYGHNELDDPTFTQPTMYNIINQRKSIPDMFSEQVITEGICNKEVLDKEVAEWNKELSNNLDMVEKHIPKAFHLQSDWSVCQQAGDVVTTWDTGVSLDTLKFVGAKSVSVPSDMNVHPTIQKTHLDRRLQKIQDGGDLDWATAEALAIGSLLYQGFNVRISGQDVGRGTFSHRHGMIVDQKTDSVYIPLNHVTDNQTGFLELANSSLSEEAVLGFEYGMSIDDPKSLIIWEAQFGDFFNGAQIMIDTYIASGELKWLLQSDLVMLLPHGMDGAGPEHSSCKIERFLQATDSSEHKVDGDNVNLQVVNATTPAQYFHLLRRQVIRNFRKPLVVVAPKTILRLPAATSTLEDMLPGKTFLPVIGDKKVKGDKVKKVIFCSGKHFYTLDKERDSRKLEDVALVRIESLCPFPAGEIQQEVTKYPNATDFLWSQEEHRNMGAWTFVSPRFNNLVGCKLRYVGRDHLGSPATGIGELHRQESIQIIEDTFS